jgi:hypothetical protein
MGCGGFGDEPSVLELVKLHGGVGAVRTVVEYANEHRVP